MIDTVNIVLNMRDLPQKGYNGRIRQCLENIKDIIDSANNVECFFGNHRNMKIMVKGDQVTIMGSLTKYLYNENFTVLTKADIKISLKQLSKSLGIPVERGTLTRIDIADNFFVQEIPNNYLESLISINRAYTDCRKGTKYFHRSRQTLVFYDKIKELDKNDPITSKRFKLKYGHQNVLRYELRLMRKLPALLNVPKVKVALLYSSSFLNKLALQWVNHYDLVNKNKLQINKLILTAKQFQMFLIYKGLKTYGNIDDVTKWINQMKIINSWDAMTTSRIKRLIKDVLNHNYLVEDSDLMNELNEKIKNSFLCKEFIIN